MERRSERFGSDSFARLRNVRCTARSLGYSHDDTLAPLNTHGQELCHRYQPRQVNT
jgi:hypothetical protein